MGDEFPKKNIKFDSPGREAIAERGGVIEAINEFSLSWTELGDDFRDNGPTDAWRCLECTRGGGEEGGQ